MIVQIIIYYTAIDINVACVGAELFTGNTALGTACDGHKLMLFILYNVIV